MLLRVDTLHKVRPLLISSNVLLANAAATNYSIRKVSGGRNKGSFPFKTAALVGIVGAVGGGFLWKEKKKKELVQQKREQWAEELKSAFPDINLRAKEGSLTEDELNMFNANATKRIDELKKELAEYQTQEGQQLKRAAMAHAEHLDKVIRTQKQLHDIENAQLVQEAVNIERNKFGKQIGSAVDRLNTIEQALNSRSAQDLEDRRAKIFWTVCLNLMDTLLTGDGNSSEEVQMATKLKEVKFIPELTENDEQGQRQPTATKYHPDRVKPPKKTRSSRNSSRRRRLRGSMRSGRRITRGNEEWKDGCNVALNDHATCLCFAPGQSHLIFHRCFFLDVQISS